MLSRGAGRGTTSVFEFGEVKTFPSAPPSEPLMSSISFSLRKTNQNKSFFGKEWGVSLHEPHFLSPLLHLHLLSERMKL